MKKEQLDHAPIVEAWLKEPIWLPEGDTARIAQLVHQTPQQRGWLRSILTRRTPLMFTATKLVAAGVIVAAFGGFLLSSGILVPQDTTPVPGATTTPPAEVTTAEPTGQPDATVAPETTNEAIDPEGALVLGEPDPGLSAGGWTQAGTAPYHNPDGTGFGQLDHLQVFGDLLVALGSTLESDEGPSHDAAFHSADGLTWVPVFLPGSDPVLNDMAATGEGLIVAGFDRVDGERVARLWSSIDGREWIEVQAPEGTTTIDQIVSAQDPLAVRANQRLFKLEDDGGWTDLDRLPNSQILRGPSGYITWQGGGQDRRFQLTMVHQAELGGEIHEVGLPGRLGRGALAQIGVQLFAVGDQWIMVPEGIETPIYVSRDGFEWQEVPRPERMLGDYVEWMGMIGDELQAFGIQYGEDGSPSGVWTIDLESTEPAPFEVLDPDGDQHMYPPVAFGDGYLATGLYTGRGYALSTWRHTGE